MVTEYFSFHLGDFQCLAINDGWFSNAPASAFLPEAPPAQLEHELQAAGLPTDVMSSPAICLFVDTGRHRILCDTGGGINHPPYGALMPGPRPLHAQLGGLLPGLIAAGIDPASIDYIIFSHAHPEHVSGNTDAAGQIVYPNAHFVWAQDEWIGIRDQIIPEQDSAWDGWAGPARFAQQQCLAIRDRLMLVQPEVEIVPGVRVFPTPGDTPHHLCVEFASGQHRLICLGDAMHGPLEIRHPEWGIGGPPAAQSRRQILERAGPTTLIHGFHFPFPGVGRFIPDTAGWRWQAIA